MPPRLQVVKPPQPSTPPLSRSQAKALRRASVRQTHPVYDRWIDDWRELGYLYEGDGPYKDGTALIAHPRELTYNELNGVVDYGNPTGETQKYKRRRQLATYENITQVIIDTITDHQYARGISRTSGGKAQRRIGDGGIRKGVQSISPYFDWLENVDGMGTHMDDWLRDYQVLANLYGHLVVVLDRLPGSSPTPRSRAEQGQQVLRAYIPPDSLDWTHYYGQLTAVKVVDPVERKDILDPHFRPARLAGTGSLLRQGGAVDTSEGVEFRIFRQDGWELYDAAGDRVSKGNYDYGRCPSAILYSKRRARIPVIGRSFLKSPTPYRDHYNLISEFRELLRAQVFSLMVVEMKDDESVETSRARLGTVISTETVLFNYRGVTYVAPPDGPTSTYLAAIERCERKIYRQAGLPWESDSMDAESAGSRRIKAMDLNRSLASMSDEAERLEYSIARLWHAGEYGSVDGQRRYADAQFAIRHPDEFFVQQVSEAVEDAKGTMEVGVGKTATARIRQQLVPLVVRNLTDEDREAIDAEIEVMADVLPALAQEAALTREGLAAKAVGAAEGEGEGGGPAPNPDEPSPGEGSKGGSTRGTIRAGKTVRDQRDGRAPKTRTGAQGERR